MTTNMNQIDPSKLDAFVTLALTDLSAGYAGVMISLGHTLGLYRALAGAGPLSSREIAARAGCDERYVREWLGSQVAGGYLVYHAISATFEMSPEQSMVLADEESPVFLPHAWNVPASMWFDEDKAIRAFRTGEGVPWSDHHGRLFCGVAAFYRNAYRASLVPEWLPALDGVVARLEEGAVVADVGCGYGHSTLLMAEAFPRSRFHGFDGHEASIAAARRHALEEHLADRVAFDAATADAYGGGPYDFISFFDCLHDMGDPVGVLQHAAASLSSTGTVMLVEPFAGDHLENEVSPVARMYYAASSTICCAHAVADGGRLVLGAQAGEARLEEVLRKAGFSRVRVVKRTPFNLIIEAKL